MQDSMFFVVARVAVVGKNLMHHHLFFTTAESEDVDTARHKSDDEKVPVVLPIEFDARLCPSINVKGYQLLVTSMAKKN